MANGGDFDVFISYRQKNQPIYAQWVYSRLSDDGYRVFLDREGLGSGVFNERLYEIIEGVNDLVLILPTGALDRCMESGDWIRKEVCHALSCGKNVVPYFIDFTWPEQLPEEMNKLRDLNYVVYSREYFKESLDKLEGFLKSHPRAEEEEELPVSVLPSPEEPEDDEPLEPEMEIRPVEPSHAGPFGQRYTRDDMKRARKELKESLTAELKQLEALLSGGSIGSKSAYRSARRSMRLIRELMGAYHFLKYDEDMARSKFERVFDPTVNKLRLYAEQGHRELNEEMTALLRQYTYGFRSVIRSLDG